MKTVSRLASLDPFLTAGAILFFLLPLAGCDLGRPPAPSAVVRDSAGITIVENPATSPGDLLGWQLTPEPLLSLGSAAGEEADQFFGISGAHRFADGRIGVVNAGSREVRIFTDTGVHLRSFGTRGGGPEEFEMPVLAGASGDTLRIVDAAHHRLTLVHPDAGFVGLTRISNDVGGYLNPAGCFASGECVFGGAFDMRKIGELHDGLNRAHTFYRSSSPDGSLATDFGDMAGAEFFIRNLEGSGQDARPALIPFGKQPLATVSPTELYFSDMDGWEIEAYAPSGERVRIIREEWSPRAVTQEDRDAYLLDAVGGTDDPEQARQIRQYLEGLPFPQEFPPFDALFGDRTGHLWVHSFPRPGEAGSRWSVYDPQGVRIGALELPEGLSPLEIGADYLLGVWRDSLGVEFIHLYGLDRRG